MCGIAGFFGDFTADLLERMNARIAHRGPDDAGVCLINNDGVGLAHRRLSIIDVSELGHQPMWDQDRTVAIVFNGEIYNYRELREELVSSGVTFKSHSDTEVLLYLYLRYGEDMLARLNGIFAFAMWDTRTASLFLARDGLGVKPLYYAQTPKGFVFASELKALLEEPSVNRKLDPAAIRYYLTYLWCPAPQTMLEGIRKLEPGNAMLVKKGEIVRQRSFYDLPYGQHVEALTVDEAVGQVRDRLQDAVRRQMIADVPVGAFLSGGLDSSVVVALAHELATDGKLQCFTIGFSDEAARREGMAEDLPYAERVARHLGVDLHTIHVGPEMANGLENMIYHLDEPQADPAPLNALFISQLARDHGIKVLLSGAGGDDIFSGYRRHYALMQERYWSWLPRYARHALAGVARRLPVTMPIGRRIRKAFQYADLESDERIVSYFYWSDPRNLMSLCGPALRASAATFNVAEPLLASLHKLLPSTGDLSKMLYLEGKHFLADHNLNYTDKMSMATGVEVRVPLLDQELVALAARLPDHFKQNGRIGKWIFKKAAEAYLPRDVIYRRKTGFGAPLRHWLRNQLKPVVEDVLSADALSRRGIFDPAGVSRLISMDRDGKIDGTYTIFSLICIELWCRLFLDGTSRRLN